MILRQFLHSDLVALAKLFGRGEIGTDTLFKAVVSIGSYLQMTADIPPAQPKTAQNRTIILSQTVAS
jgi:hypothetical protein